MKKEIKKLQRLREQIKVWQTQNEIKDKDALLRNRRLVESAMERYKQVEKDSKHKAYSKEGLTQPEQLSPEEQEKQDAIEYVKNVLEELQIQLESLEAELAKLQTTGRKSKKGGLSAKDQERKTELDDIMNMFKFHQQQLELVLRLLQNGKLEPEALNDLKDDIQYFVESNQEPDFMYDDSIYETLGLEERDNILVHDVKSSFDGINGEGKLSEDSSEREDSPVISSSNSNGNGNATKIPSRKASPAPSHNGIRSLLAGIRQSSPSPQPISSAFPPSAIQLRPAAAPARPVTDKKWAVAAGAAASLPSQSQMNDQKQQQQQQTAMPISSSQQATTAVQPNNGNVFPPFSSAASVLKDNQPIAPQLPPQLQIPPHVQKQQPQQQSPFGIPGQPGISGQAINGDVSASTNPDVTSLSSSLLQNKHSGSESQNERIDFNNDVLVASIPPGIQSFVSSFVETRGTKTSKILGGEKDEESNGKGETQEQEQQQQQKKLLQQAQHYQITNVVDLLINPRKDLTLGYNSTLHPSEFAKLNSEWDAFRCQFRYDPECQQILDLDIQLAKADVLVLFFGFYYGLTAIERKIAKRGLFLKNWRLHVNGILWFYKLNQSSATTEKYEIASYEIFDAFNWNVRVISNYQLEFSQLAPIDLV